MSKKRAVLIYDSECPVCGSAVQWMRDNQQKDAFEFLPCRSGQREKRFPEIREALCMDAMQLALPDGRVLAGEKALPEILKRLKRYGALSGLFRLPGSEAFSRSFYRWFAGRRYHIAKVLFAEKHEKDKKTRMTRKGT